MGMAILFTVECLLQYFSWQPTPKISWKCISPAANYNKMRQIVGYAKLKQLVI